MLYINYQGSSTFLQEDFQDFPTLLYINQNHKLYIIQCKTVTPGRVSFDPRGII